MSNLLWKSLLAGPVALGTVLTVASVSVAAESAPAEPSVQALGSQDSLELAQVTSVDELSDVQPTDWAFTALQNLVETYGCIEGYPNRTFRGDRALTRYEFAAGLNACLDVISNLIVGGGVGESDLATIRRLQEEFQAELATLRGRVDALEADVAELEANQFSTTTKLRGEVVGHIVGPFDELEGVEDSTTFLSRARLNFDASFTGRDRLRVRLEAGSGEDALVAARGGDDFEDNGGDLDVNIDDLYYNFPVGDRLTVEVAAIGRSTDDFATSSIVPWDGNSVSDPGEPPLYDFGMGGSAGIGASFQLTENIFIDGGYSFDANDGSDPLVGLAGSDEQSYFGQVSYLSDFISAAAVYLRGTDGVDFPEVGGFGFVGGADATVTTETIGGLLSVDFGRFIVAGSFGYHDLVEGTAPATADDFTTSWQAGIALPDLFIEGSQLGAFYVALPEFTSGINPWMVEGYYQIPINEFLEITPSLIYGDIDTGVADEEAFYGAIRAKFKF